MIINQRRVRNIVAHLGALPTSQSIRCVVDATPDRLTRAGFAAEPDIGDAVLPPAVGKVSRFNSDGSFQVHRDLPKESRYITTISWTWKQFRGRDDYEEITETRPIYRDCYPRTPITAPSVELVFVRIPAGEFLVSPELTWNDASHAEIQHAVNLMLELFGVCDVRTQDLATIAPPAIRRVNWSLLPAGQHPWSRVQQHVQAAVSNRSTRYASPVLYRHALLASKAPPEVYVGTGGFRDYVAFVFPSRKIAVLESTKPGNATYVFGLSWATVSQLTKAQVLAGNLHLRRIVHDLAWEAAINQLLPDPLP